MSSTIVLFPVSYSVYSDLGLFLFDVVSDILNGKNFIDEGNPRWGWTVIGVLFIPMTGCYVSTAATFLGNSSPIKNLLTVAALFLLAPLAIPIMTAGYLIYVPYVYARRIFLPSAPSEVMTNTAGLLKYYEGVWEANIQAVIG